MKALSVLAFAVLLGGCATQPFGATWYFVQNPGTPGTDTAGAVYLALLNQSSKPCEVDAIELNGVDDAHEQVTQASVTKINIGFELPPGRVLVVRTELPRCIVPVRIVVKVHGDACRAFDRFGMKVDPEIKLIGGFPNYLPSGWDKACSERSP